MGIPIDTGGATPVSGGNEGFRSREGFSGAKSFSEQKGWGTKSPNSKDTSSFGARRMAMREERKNPASENIDEKAILEHATSVSAKKFLGATVKAMKETGLLNQVLSKGSQTKKNTLKVAVGLAQAITNKKISIDSSYVGKKATNEYLKKYARDGLPKDGFAQKREGFSTTAFKRAVMGTGAKITGNEIFKRRAKGG